MAKSGLKGWMLGEGVKCFWKDRRELKRIWADERPIADFEAI